MTQRVRGYGDAALPYYIAALEDVGRRAVQCGVGVDAAFARTALGAAT